MAGRWGGREREVVALDVGTQKICCAAGVSGGEGDLEVRALSVVPSEGVQAGVIVDLGLASHAIQRAVEAVEEQLEGPVTRLFANVSGEHLTGQHTSASLVLSEKGCQIGPQHVERLLERAAAIPLSFDRQVYQRLPRGFAVDGHEGVRQPVGLYGAQLDVSLLLVTGRYAPWQNLVSALERVGCDPAPVVASAVASAVAVTREDERTRGVVVLDIGEGVTDVVAYAHGVPGALGVLAGGGGAVTRSLSQELHLALEEAETRKRQAATAEVSGAGRDAAAARVLGREIDALLAGVQGLVEGLGVLGQPGAGVVITGGAARMAGLLERAEAVLGVPARLGVPWGVRGSAWELGSPASATCLGLLRTALDRQHASLTAPGQRVRWVDRVLTQARELVHDYF